MNKSSTAWYKSYEKAKHRCSPKGKYYKRGIKFQMTLKDFYFLWKRDNGHLLKRPSIDRINTHGDYILDNCRFIELHENRRRLRNDTYPRNPKCRRCNRLYKRYGGKGMCHSCYCSVNGYTNAYNKRKRLEKLQLIS